LPFWPGHSVVDARGVAGDYSGCFLMASIK